MISSYDTELTLKNPVSAKTRFFDGPTEVKKPGVGSESAQGHDKISGRF
jgi:hypothetical protein